jgi:hypothetical protein
MPKSKTTRGKFWDKAVKEGCWEWPAGKHNGYGVFHWQGKRTGAHRVAWMTLFGNIPEGLQVCHSCDNPSCVRPDHLFLGTFSENQKDKVDKDRTPKGSIHWNAKLTEDKVRTIKKRLSFGAFKQELARTFGVAYGTINDIAMGKTWKHV